MDETTLAAAFLHDVVEDTETTLDQLKEMFGVKVADLVDGVPSSAKSNTSVKRTSRLKTTANVSGDGQGHTRYYD